MYTILTIAATVLTVHLIGAVYFHHINSTNRNTARHYYCFTSSSAKQDGASEHLPLPVITDESECDSDDGFKTEVNSRCVNRVRWGEAQTLPYYRQQERHQYHTRTLPSPAQARAKRYHDQTAAALQNAYSETKV